MKDTSPDMCTGPIVSQLEGGLLKSPDPFPYFMLVAFEASGLIRYTILLVSYPILKLLDCFSMHRHSLKLMIFIAVVGVKESEIKAVARAVLPKFFMDDVDFGAWEVCCRYQKRVVVSKCFPTVMMERFVKEHLRADEVVGCELEVNRAGIATGFVREGRGVVEVLGGERPEAGLGRDRPGLAMCKEPFIPPFPSDHKLLGHRRCLCPHPVIFHDSRLVRRPTPINSLLLLLYLPFGILLAAFRILVGLIVPIHLAHYFILVFGGRLIVRGRPPPSSSTSAGGVLFVCTHRTLMDPVVLSMALHRQIPAVTYSISTLSRLLSPIKTIPLTRHREIDAHRIKEELHKGDLILCPEGTTCREPFLLRFSALFAELTDRIVPVAMDYKPGFFHATTARGWKAMDPIFFFMNPRPVYEVTFLNQLPVEDTCTAGKSAVDVANCVQRMLGAALGFECTDFTRSDKYRVLAGNDGTVSLVSVSINKSAETWLGMVRDMVGFLLQ